MQNTKLNPFPFCLIQKEDLIVGNDLKLKKNFYPFFELSQTKFNPYYVIAVVEKPAPQTFTAYDGDYLRQHPELFSLLDKVQLFAYKCFDFQNFKAGEEPQKTSIETAKLEPFIIESFLDAEQPSGWTWEKSQILIGCQFSNVSIKIIKMAQWNTAFAYERGLGVSKNSEEGIKWAWCATQPSDKGIIDAITMVGVYYFDLSTHQKTDSQKLLKCSKKWLKKAATKDDKNSLEMLNLIRQKYKKMNPQTRL